MDSKDLKFLVNKYWEGNTSLEEEALLKKWFTRNDVPHEMELEAEYFKQLNDAAQMKLDGKFDEKVLDKITGKETKVINWTRFAMNWRVAAVISGIVVASFVLKNPFASSNISEDTYDNPQDAYEATKAILLTISSSMNKGKKYTQQLSKFSEAQKIVSETGAEPAGDGS